jgi:hypothetical protein
MAKQTPRLVGNKFWKLRTTHGRGKLFSDPALLLEEAYAYFDWCDRHPWERSELVKYQGSAYEEAVSIGRPYSIEGFTCYLGVSASYFRSAKANIRTKQDEGRATPEEDELVETIELIEQIVKTQNIEGAAVNVFSPHIVTRMYNMAETINQNNTGESTVRVTVRDQKTADDLNALDDIL